MDKLSKRKQDRLNSLFEESMKDAPPKKYGDRIGLIELCKAISLSLDIYEWEVRFVLELFIYKIINNVKAGNKVQIMNLGSFFHRHCSAKKGYSYETREYKEMPAYTAVRFKPSKYFKEEVKEAFRIKDKDRIHR